MAEQSRSEVLQRVFVVLDPTRLTQPALTKGEGIAAHNGAQLQLYCCLNAARHADDEAQETLVRYTEEWVERLAERPRSQGAEVSVRVDVDPDWREAIIAAANEFDSQLVVKTTSQRGTLQRRLMKTSDWALIRKCAGAVMLVNDRQLSIPKTMLAAVKLKPGDDTYVTLNERIVTASHQMADVLGAELHAVTVYQDEDIYFDRQRFANACRLPRNRVHSVEGAPYQGIAEVAKQIGAGTVIVGSARQPGGSILGRTAERVIDEVTANVLVLPPAEPGPET